MYIHVFKDNVLVSENGANSNPITMGPLNASNDEISAAQALVLKTDPSYISYGSTQVSFEGTTAGKWSVSETIGGVYAPTLTITTAIDSTTGKTIFVKSLATSDESPANDVSVSLKVTSTIAAV